MQFSNLDYWHLLISGVISGLVWLLLFFYRSKGRNQLRLIAKGELSEPVGLGSWYAGNITRVRLSILYSIFQYSLVPILFWTILSFSSPTNFPTVIEYTWIYFLIFFLMGLGDGFDLGYRWWGTVEENDSVKTDES